MPAPKDLIPQFSFIEQLLNDPDLAAYGNNAMPLYALTLYLGIEDLATFAVESLTDQPNDKKADVIYINEAEGLACIAQNLTSPDWGRQEAPANKASDLNTAAAWLLQCPLDEVPDTIRSHAMLLREGLEAGTINRVLFAYAHNAFESKNVEAELQVVSHLVKGLPITANAEVDVVELGLRLTETLYLTSQGSIQVSDQIDLPLAQSFLQTSDDWEAYVVPLSGATLYALYDEHKSALFSANLRDFLGTRKSSGNVNNQIKETAENNGADFFVLNNGVTLVTKKAELVGDSLRIHGISVVNGAQTTGAIYAAGADKAGSVSVLARIIVAKDPALIPAIVAGNNTQNSIVAWDRRSNDPIQIRIAQEFGSKGITYVHRRDFSRKPATSIFAGQVGQMLCAFGGGLQTAIRAKAEIFESDVTYNEVFPATLSIGHVFAIQALGWAYDQIKQELKGKAASGAMTELEQRQLKLLDYPASKQFMMTVVGNLREEIAGTKVERPQALEMKTECLTPDGADAIAAWKKVLRSILPTIVQGLPGDEYQVVRSTELTNKVAERTKGIVAGADVIQDNFHDLRKLLKPI